MEVHATTKILDIHYSQLPATLIKALEFCECYTDNKSTEHIYNSFDLLNDTDNFKFKSNDRHKLRHIESLCMLYGCKYFRIINQYHKSL